MQNLFQKFEKMKILKCFWIFFQKFFLCFLTSNFLVKNITSSLGRGKNGQKKMTSLPVVIFNLPFKNLRKKFKKFLCSLEMFGKQNYFKIWSSNQKFENIRPLQDVFLRFRFLEGHFTPLQPLSGVPFFSVFFQGYFFNKVP